jgi:hypothetical protein
MQVTITIKTVQNKFPGGTVGGNWRIELMTAADPNTVVLEYEGAAPSTNFDLTEGDVWNVRGYRVDPAGGTLGPVATDQFTVGADLVPLDVADTITVTSMPARRAGSAGVPRYPRP